MTSENSTAEPTQASRGLTLFAFIAVGVIASIVMAVVIVFVIKHDRAETIERKYGPGVVIPEQNGKSLDLPHTWDVNGTDRLCIYEFKTLKCVDGEFAEVERVDR